jgi:BirA family biotin operon repressor/biotin-[acetyl-CoA-carboxylase] ligase
VVGVGLNVNQVDFPPELTEIATSLRLITGEAHDRGSLLAALLAALEPAIEGAFRGEVESSLARWRHHAALPRPCRVLREGIPLEGTAIDIGADGALLVRDHDGHEHRVLAGELAPG